MSIVSDSALLQPTFVGPGTGGRRRGCMFAFAFSSLYALRTWIRALDALISAANDELQKSVAENYIIHSFIHSKPTKFRGTLEV